MKILICRTMTSDEDSASPYFVFCLNKTALNVFTSRMRLHALNVPEIAEPVFMEYLEKWGECINERQLTCFLNDCQVREKRAGSEFDIEEFKKDVNYGGEFVALPMEFSNDEDFDITKYDTDKSDLDHVSVDVDSCCVWHDGDIFFTCQFEHGDVKIATPNIKISEMAKLLGQSWKRPCNAMRFYGIVDKNFDFIMNDDGKPSLFESKDVADYIWKKHCESDSVDVEVVEVIINRI